MRIKLLIILALLNLNVFAVEGMWEPSQMDTLKKELKNTGYSGDADNLTDLFSFPLNAIVSLGGCSASFVSPEGLIATNYHCIEGSYLQFNSSEKEDLFETGFVARSKSEEKPSAPGSSAYVTQSITNVTKAVLRQTENLKNDLDRYNKIESNKKSIIEECETSDEIRCNVRSFFSGETYQLEKRLKIRDVRLVYAPPASIGEYGGEIDNWMFPRHTGDFALLRAYVAPDGSSKEFAKQNKPYKSKNYLKISAKGVQEGDFVMVAGYPGTTNRLLTYNEVEFDIEEGFKGFVNFLKSGIDIMRSSTKDKDGSSLKYRGLISGYENYYKKISGQIDGAESFSVQDKANSDWLGFIDYLNEKGSRQEKDSLDSLLSLIDDQKAKELPNYYYGNSRMISTAQRIYRYAYERTKPNDQREIGFQERDHENIVNGIKSLDYRLDKRVDKEIFIDRLEKYRTFDGNLRRPQFSNYFQLDADFKKSKKIVEDTYSQKSLLDSAEDRLSLIDLSLDELNSINDPFINIARILFDEQMEYENIAKSEASEKQRLKSTFIKSLRKYYKSIGKSLYSDANGTLRITFGNVKGVSLEDGITYGPFTRLEGINKKHNGEEPFDAPDKLMDLISQKNYGRYELESLGSVPVNFLCDLDITNGNSGSATLNAKGELVGLAFDGMLQTIIADYKYIPEARTISVDSRYFLWTLEKFDEARNILEELSIEY
jgi:V8-like Glu-specific endopeptidase